MCDDDNNGDGNDVCSGGDNRYINSGCGGSRSSNSGNNSGGGGGIGHGGNANGSGKLAMTAWC